ncbi:hypothetical protein ACO0QE_002871 [Hanseniaspora vineae]
MVEKTKPEYRQEKYQQHPANSKRTLQYMENASVNPSLNEDQTDNAVLFSDVVEAETAEARLFDLSKDILAYFKVTYRKLLCFSLETLNPFEKNISSCEDSSKNDWWLA